MTDAKTWLEKRRPELVKLFEEIQFGKMPPRPSDLSFEVVDKGTPVLNGEAIRKQVTVYFTKDHSDHKMDLLIYLPVNVKKAPLALKHLIRRAEPGGRRPWCSPSARSGAATIKRSRPTVRLDSGRSISSSLSTAGFGFATVYYGDIEPDFKDGIKYGIRSVYLKPGQTEVAN